MPVILGPTASGKTRLAVALADRIGAEIISADSRQVYRGLDIGSGKDLSEYRLNGRDIPYHLIDCVDVDDEYNVFRYQRDFVDAFRDIVSRGKIPIVCGGTGMYLESILSGYRMLEVPENKCLREELASKTDLELVEILQNLRSLHNVTDSEDRDRLVRAIEIADYTQNHLDERNDFPKFNACVFGLRWEPDLLRDRIARRLDDRIAVGMIEEVESLIDAGVSVERLDRLGLEYRFVCRYLKGELSQSEMIVQLRQAIGKFAKRQRTWFRRMERKGTDTLWLDGMSDIDRNVMSIVGSVMDE